MSFILKYLKLLGTYIYVEWKHGRGKSPGKNVCRIKYEIWYLSSRNVIFWSASGKSVEVSSHNCVWSDNSSEATGKRTAQLLVDVEFELYSVLLVVEKKNSLRVLPHPCICPLSSEHSWNTVRVLRILSCAEKHPDFSKEQLEDLCLELSNEGAPGGQKENDYNLKNNNGWIKSLIKRCLHHRMWCIKVVATGWICSAV